MENSNFKKLKNLLSESEEDFTKFFEKGNSAAGTRIRKCMQDLKTLAQETRLEVQERKNK